MHPLLLPPTPCPYTTLFRSPEWLRIRLGDPTNQNHLLKLIEGLNLHTVCQEARCPNIFECWSDRTATFMLGGDICTDRKSTRLNSSHLGISYAVFCLKKKK